jgi:hypothetical protein
MGGAWCTVPMRLRRAAEAPAGTGVPRMRLPGSGRQRGAEHREQAGLAGTGRPDQGDALALVSLQPMSASAGKPLAWVSPTPSS